MRRLVLGVLIISIVLAGCAQKTPSGTDDAMTVVAAFYPLAEASEQIGGLRVEVTNLTPPGAEPHDLELSTDQLDEIIDADVVVHMGEGFQPALEEAVDRAEGVVLDVLEGEQLRGRDPHIWLDPQRWAGVVDRIGDTLAKSDQEGAATFAKNERDYLRDIAELDSEFEDGLASCDRDVLVTSHAAFSYLAERYGLEQHSISGISPEAEPDPEHLAELADLVKEEGVTTIYTETLVSADVAETLAREAGVELATLNPIEGLSELQLQAGEGYVSVMRDNLDVIREGLGCK
jgi:zinc transport system substrate-binding protein